MKYKWLNKKNNSKLIVFFNGWGMDESVVNHLNPRDFDVLMIYDYNNPYIDLETMTSEYSEKYLVAWSMGVMTASVFNMQYQSKTAVNGTLKPIDDDFGIPKRIYNLTIKGFSPKGADRFIHNMFNDNTPIPSVNRTFENQQSELNALLNYNANLDFNYDRIIISSEDKIIPTKNQEAFWNLKANINAGHCPFYRFTNWSELL